MKMPNTPFSTRLSGSAKETELRIRNIFQWKKKRPPVVLVVLIAALLLSCFGLFSCVPEAPEPEDKPGDETSVNSGLVGEDQDPAPTKEQPAEELPTLTVAVEDLYDTMQQIGEKEDYPAQTYQIEVTGLSVPVTLTMDLNLATAVEAHGQFMTLTEPLVLYGNRNFELFEADGAVILQGDYYWVSDIYVLTPEKTSEVHPGEELSYAVYLDAQGLLKYQLVRNDAADITQMGCLSVATGYDEFLRAYGNASVENGELVFAEPHERLYMEYDMLQQEFELGWWNEHYDSVEEIFEINRAGKEGREPSPVYSLSYRDDLICDYFAQTLQCGVYMAHEVPEQVHEGDRRIDEIVVLGETIVYEVTGQLLTVYQSYYDGSGWSEFSDHLVITKGIDNAYQRVIGFAFMPEGLSVEEIIKEKIWGLSDLEVSLFRDGYPSPAGPGTSISFHREVYDGPESVEVLEGWEPIYYEGDYWAVHRWNGVEALCYHRAADGGYGVNTFDTTRTDLSTYRGIRVGDSREAVKAAYPELKSGDYWGKYPGEDYLWYCSSEQDFGAALIFFFEGDAVSRIVLTNMFN